MKAWSAAAAVAVACLGTGEADAAPPAPPQRPAEFGRVLPEASQAPVVPLPAPAAPVAGTRAAPTSAAMPAAASCIDALRARAVRFEPVGQPAPGEPRCAVADAVRLLAIPGPEGDAIDLPERPVVACALAGPFAEWAGGVVASVLGASRGARVTAIRTGPGFECRGRNRQADTKLSAHGSGLALDVASFVFTDGSTLSVREPRDGAVALSTVRRAACGWFTTVLGPGSDPFHADHLHVDVQLHGSSDRYRICQ